MGYRQSVEAHRWLAYIGRTINNVTHAGNDREVHLARVTNLKVHGYCPETNDVYQYLGCFGMGVNVCPIDKKPIGNIDETLLRRYEETMAKLQNTRNAGYNVVSIWSGEFRKLQCETPRLENERSSHHYLKNYPTNIMKPLYCRRTSKT